tara:strand:- start:25 stop:723 length:699 start_codon:yes stop_codon:yes gene_type:complete
MPLPEIVTPTYTLTVPSTKKKLKYRPFLVKEQKTLILALEQKDSEQTLEAIKNVLNSCIISKVNLDDMALFDIEYIFLQVRAKSISEEIEMKVTCPDDNETEVNVTFLVDDVKVHFPKGHTNIFKISDEITVEMKYPDMEYFATITFSQDTVDPYELVGKCIKRVYVGEEPTGSFTPEEAREWIETLTNSQFAMIQEFFNTMPTLRHVLNVRNPKTKVEHEIVIEGLADFFA